MSLPVETSMSFDKQNSSTKHPPIVFLLLAIHNDQSIMYNESMSMEEAQLRAKNSLTGLTIVSIDNQTSGDCVNYNGLILRSAWETLQQNLFQRLKRSLVFRDKCCNQRNLNDLTPFVITDRKSKVRRIPSNYSCVVSKYQYDRFVKENLSRPFEANPFLTGLAGSEDSSKRYENHYRRIIEFIYHETKRLGGDTADKRPIVVYHKLPIAIANWLVNDIQQLWPGVQFKFLGHTVSAREIRTSPHCLRRVNHNVCMCEVCLTDAYAPQLIETLTKRDHNENKVDYKLTSVSFV